GGSVATRSEDIGNLIRAGFTRIALMRSPLPRYESHWRGSGRSLVVPGVVAAVRGPRLRLRPGRRCPPRGTRPDAFEYACHPGRWRTHEGWAARHRGWR